MAQIFVQGAARMSFDGEAVFALDAATLGTPYAFAAQRVAFVQSDNNSYPDLIDGAAFTVNKVPGVVLGQLQVSGVLQVDRGVHTYLNTRFGPRTAGQLTPDVMNLVPYSGGTPIKAAGVYWNTFRLSSAFAVSGGQSMVMFQATAYVTDPNNYFSAPTLSVPSYVGVAGAGITPFSRCSFNNDSTTTYDQIRAFDFALSNGMNIIPGMKNTAQKIAAGFTPSTIKGALTLTQLAGATNPLPQASGTYPIDLLLPSGDGTHTLTVATSQSYDSVSRPYSPTDYVQNSVSYSMFSTSATATSTANWPFVASYA